MSESCREACDQSGEPLAGSAGQAAGFVAIAWPKRRWHADKAARSEGLPAELAALENEAKQAGRKLALRVFQRGPGAGCEQPELLLQRDGAGFRAEAVPLDRLVQVIRAGLAGEDPGIPTVPLERELLICTDGVHDDCCARFGRPLYKALCEAVERSGSALRVSECSHLGGHRFAANALSLPRGDLYGRLTPADTDPLLHAIEADRVLRYRYRGRLGQDESLQAAEALLAARLPEGAQWTIDGEPCDRSADHCRVPATVRDPDGERQVQVRCETRAFACPSSCGGEREERRRWVGVEIESLS